jgi:hypothetical protein
MVQVRVDLYNLLFMPRHDLNPTRDTRINNYFEDLETQHESNRLGLRDLTCLITLIRLANLYSLILNYSYFDMTRTQYSTREHKLPPLSGG